MKYAMLLAAVACAELVLHGEELQGVDTWAGIKPLPGIPSRPSFRRCSFSLENLRTERSPTLRNTSDSRNRWNGKGKRMPRIKARKEGTL